MRFNQFFNRRKMKYAHVAQKKKLYISSYKYSIYTKRLLAISYEKYVVEHDPDNPHMIG